MPNGNLLERHSEVILPNIVLVANIHQKGAAPIWREKATEVIWCVPEDNETVRGICISAWPADENGERVKGWRAGTDTVSDIRPGQLRDRSYADKQRKPDDMEAQEGQRPVPIHASETLGRVDTGIAAYRRKLRAALADIKEGRDPPNILRDEAENRMIETSCWNTVTAPAARTAAE